MWKRRLFPKLSVRVMPNTWHGQNGWCREYIRGNDGWSISSSSVQLLTLTRCRRLALARRIGTGRVASRENPDSFNQDRFGGYLDTTERVPPSMRRTTAVESTRSAPNRHSFVPARG